MGRWQTVVAASCSCERCLGLIATAVSRKLIARNIIVHEVDDKTKILVTWEFRIPSTKHSDIVHEVSELRRGCSKHRQPPAGCFLWKLLYEIWGTLSDVVNCGCLSCFSSLYKNCIFHFALHCSHFLVSKFWVRWYTVFHFTLCMSRKICLHIVYGTSDRTAASPWSSSWRRRRRRRKRREPAK